MYGFRAHFDVEVYSYDHNAGKDDPRFLEALLTAVGASPGAILTIDDSPDVLALAERRGLNVVHYTMGQVARVVAAMQRLGMGV